LFQKLLNYYSMAASIRHVTRESINQSISFFIEGHVHTSITCFLASIHHITLNLHCFWSVLNVVTLFAHKTRTRPIVHSIAVPHHTIVWLWLVAATFRSWIIIAQEAQLSQRDARYFVSLNISLSHVRQLKFIRNDNLQKAVSHYFDVTMFVCRIVCEIFSVK